MPASIINFAIQAAKPVSGFVMQLELSHFTCESNTHLLIHILKNVDSLKEVLAMALTSRAFYSRLASYLPTALLTTDDERTNCERRLFSVFIAGVLYKSLDTFTNFEPMLTLRFSWLQNEYPLQHLIRNYFFFMPPSVGLECFSLLEKVQTENQDLLDMFFNLQSHQIYPLLKQECPKGLSLICLRAELCKHIKLLSQITKSVDPQEALNTLRTTRSQRFNDAAAAMKEATQALTSFNLTDPASTIIKRACLAAEPLICIDFSRERNIYTIMCDYGDGRWRNKTSARRGFSGVKQPIQFSLESHV